MSGPFISARAWRIDVCAFGRLLVAVGEQLEELAAGRPGVEDAMPPPGSREAGRLGQAVEELAGRQRPDRHRGEQVGRASSSERPTALVRL